MGRASVGLSPEEPPLGLLAPIVSPGHISAVRTTFKWNVVRCEGLQVCLREKGRLYKCRGSGLASIVGWKGGHIIRYLPGHVPSQYGRTLAKLKKRMRRRGEEGDVFKIWVILWSIIMGWCNRKEYIA